MKFDAIFRNKKYISVVISFILTFVLLLAVSVAWLCSVFEVEPDGEFAASSIAAYFAGGDGSKEHPYEIEAPVHIYNLAWLQHLGVFNEEVDGKIEQTYFIMNNDVVIEEDDELIIPPIGNEEHPFVGNFNGNNCYISGVTVSNYLSQTDGDGGISEMPSSVTDIDTSISTDDTTKSIIGFFGVIGDWDDSLGEKIVDDTQTTLDIPSKVNAVYDLRLDRLTIRSDTDESLMGLLAGYVNGSLKNVGIGSGALVTGNDLQPLNITGLQMQALVSHYSLIGEYNEEEVYWPSKPVLGGWGDSIDMLDMYTRLSTTVWDKVENLSYVSSEIITYDADGNEVSRVTNETETNKIRAVNMGALGNYIFSTNTEDYIDSTTYMYLYGPAKYTKTVFHRRPTNRKGDYIYLGNSYLSVTVNNNSATVSSNTQNNADAWTLDDDGYLYTVKDFTYYYLNGDNGNLTVSTDKSTKWERPDIADNSGNLYCMVNGEERYLFCENGVWGLYQLEQSGYKISSGSNYLIIDGDEIGRGTNEDTATVWTISDTDPFGGTIYANGYYLNAIRSGNTSSLGLSETEQDSNTSKTTFTGSNNRTLSVRLRSGNNTRTYYVRYNNNRWTLTDSNNNATRLTFTEVSKSYTTEELAISFDTDHLISDEYADTEEEVEYTKDTDATWFPLGIETDEDGNEYVSAGNTGYVVSSADYQHLTSAPQKSGNIRVSQYSRNDIRNSLTNNALAHNKIYTISYKNKEFGTIGSVDDVESTWGFSKYADSFDKFNNTVSSSNNIYGLHFMQTENNISTEHKISIDGAKILQTDGMSHTYNGYELPRNAITFNVVEDGYINFFAGTFFSGNENFFSLHHVVRDESNTKLESIKEIAEIYGLFKDGELIEYEPYVYKYTDGTYSEGYSAIPTGYELIFDTKWITDQDTIGMLDDRVYYFEVPVNAGEYALGSVAGEDVGDGAYLLYLDLAANGSRKVADDAEHAIMGVNFIDDEGFERDADGNLKIEDIAEHYPVMSAQVALDNGVTTHGGVTVAFDRQSKENINYQVSGDGADSFTVTFVSADGTTATETPVTVSLANNLTALAVENLSLSSRRRRLIFFV